MKRNGSNRGDDGEEEKIRCALQVLGRLESQDFNDHPGNCRLSQPALTGLVTGGDRRGTVRPAAYHYY